MLIISENDLNGDISYDIKTIVDGKIKEQHNIRCKATKIEVDNKECVKKSYPSFWEDFKQLGGIIDER